VAAGSLPSAMREPLAGLTIQIDDTEVAASTTIAAVGAAVLILATAIPERAISLTSCYLARSDAAIAVSQLAVDAAGERLSQHLIGPTEHHATLAGACLLEHAATLREQLARHGTAHVAVDVDPRALEHAATAWTPSTSTDRGPRL
jgi:hypothetical protein